MTAHSLNITVRFVVHGYYSFFGALLMKYQAALIAGLLAGSVLITACGPTYEVGKDAQIRVEPAKQVTFSRVKKGEVRTQPVVVSNVGRDQLRVSQIVWDGSDAVSLAVEGSDFPRLLDAQAQFALSVKFSPTNATPSPDGTIHIYSNDLDTPIYDVQVVAQQLEPQIHVVPSAEEKLIFGQVDEGASLKRPVVVTNTGDLPLEISKISLVASGDFQLTSASTLNLPLSLTNEDRLDLNVTFTPTASGRAEGNLVFTTNDPNHPTYTLPIVANSDSPCLRIQPVIVEFKPSVSVETTATREVTLESCSDVELSISGIQMASGDDAFSYKVRGDDRPLKNGESATMTISYTPEREGTNKAEFVVMSNDPLQPNATITVMGTASSNQCPTAVARARMSSASDWARSVDAAPLDTIIFDGSLSHDEESTTLNYYWNIKSAPKDSTSKLAMDNEKATLFADLAGEYVVCLNVEDSAGMMSCNEDCLKVTATPRETLHMQLVWSTPGDATPGDDDGTDLDLHFVRLLQGSDAESTTTRPEKGTWGDKGSAELLDGSDVYFENREPVWFVEGFGNELPSLDIDDKDGEGPENINLDNPSPCSWYAIGVHYYNDYAFGPSYATVRVYVSGKARFEKPNILLSQSGGFKQVALLHWDGSTARIYESIYAYDSIEQWKGQPPVLPEEIIEKAKVSAPKCFAK